LRKTHAEAYGTLVLWPIGQQETPNTEHRTLNAERRIQIQQCHVGR